jgi:hypothetical protein
LVKFGTFTLPHVLSVDEETTRTEIEKHVPGREFPYRRDRGGMGKRFTLAGEIRRDTDIELTRDKIARLADGAARTLDLELNILETGAEWSALEKALRYETSPTWTDDTDEAEMPGGTPFTLLGAASDYFYFGHRERFNTLHFDLQTLGNYGARTWEYAKGTGSWGTLTLTSDGTNGFSQDGAVVFSPPSDWKHDTVNAIVEKFWLRVAVASVTTAATSAFASIRPRCRESLQDTLRVDIRTAGKPLGSLPLRFLQRNCA